MRVTVRKLSRGGRGAIPPRLGIHVVAAAYGQDPRDVAEWPADLYLDALSFRPVTALRSLPRGSDDG